MNRRTFVSKGVVAGGAALLLGQKIARGSAEPEGPHANPVGAGSAAESPVAPAPVKLTVAGLQMVVSTDVEANEKAVHRGIEKAAAARADFLLTPEGSVSGYYPGFDGAAVTAAVQRLARHARESRVGLLLGTCYKEMAEDAPSPFELHLDPSARGQRQELCLNQVRVYEPGGEYLGAHSKILLTSTLRHPGTGEMRDYVAGTLRTFSWRGVCFGVLICNDLWATPGYTTTPNPYLAWRLRQMGAQVIFHAVNSGFVQFYRPYHEMNQALWAGALGIPIVAANASHEVDPVNCRSGVVGPNGERKNEAPDIGEQFFSCELSLG
jgi:predicted amidohydrolase